MAASNYLIVAAPTLVNVVGGLSQSDLQIDAAKGAVSLVGRNALLPIRPTAPLNFRIS